MYTRISTPVNRMMPALNAVSTVPRAMAATGSDTRWSCFFFVKNALMPLRPRADPSSAPAGCGAQPAGV